MRIIVTGASGNIGSELVPQLASRGFHLLLVGRDPEMLRRRFEQFDACSYDQLVDQAAGFDALLNLAVVNSDSSASEAEFNAVNAELPLRLANHAVQLGIRRFVYISSLHALETGRDTAYSRSKRLGRQKLLGVTGLDVCTVYLPAFHGHRLTGRWSTLNNLPAGLRGAAVNVLSALKPVVDSKTLAEKLTHVLSADSPPPEIVISNGQTENPVYQTLRRTIDLMASLSIIVFLWWLLLLVWILVRTKSEGPGLFAQERVGRHGQTFTCYKFRTMHVGTRQAATHEITTSSVTSVGKVLRRTKLDELPQVLNLLKGEMTLVGPRPCLPSQTELVEERRRAGVLELTPGITGLAQVNGVDMSVPKDLVVYDQRYLGMQGLLLDLKLLIMTATGKGSGDRVSS